MSTDELPRADPRTGQEDFSQMALQLHDEATLQSTVQRVLEYAVDVLECDHAGVIFVHRGPRVVTVAATDPLVAELDKIQVEIGQGPDLEVVRTEETVIIADTRTEARWPEWAALVDAAGIRSMMGTRLHTTDSTIGTLNFFSTVPHRFGEEDRLLAESLARHAAVALDSARDTESLWKAIDARHLIGQAQGILMERFKVDPDRAFSILRRYSQDRNVKLRDVAQELIQTGTLAESPTRPPSPARE